MRRGNSSVRVEVDTIYLAISAIVAAPPYSNFSCSVVGVQAIFVGAYTDAIEDTYNGSRLIDPNELGSMAHTAYISATMLDRPVPGPLGQSQREPRRETRVCSVFPP